MSSCTQRKKSLRDSLLERLPHKKQQQILSQYLNKCVKKQNYLVSNRNKANVIATPAESKAIVATASCLHLQSCASNCLIDSEESNTVPPADLPSEELKDYKEDAKSIISTSTSSLTKQKSESMIRSANKEATRSKEENTCEWHDNYYIDNVPCSYKNVAQSNVAIGDQSDLNVLSFSSLESINIRPNLHNSPMKQSEEEVLSISFAKMKHRARSYGELSPELSSRFIRSASLKPLNLIIEEALCVRDSFSCNLSGSLRKIQERTTDTKLQRGKSLNSLSPKQKVMNRLKPFFR